MKKLALFAILALIPSVSFAAPVKIPTLKACAGPTGAINIKQRCAKNETVLEINNLVAQGVQGPQGVQGTPGIPGSFNISQCFKREGISAGQGLVIATTACLVSEFIVSSACSSSSTDSYLMNSKLYVSDNSQLGKEAYGQLLCVMNTTNNSFHSVTAQALCCRP